MSLKSFTLMLALALPLPTLSQEALSLGLVGKVHTLLTVEVDYRENPSGAPSAKRFEVFDPKGSQLESYLYKPDGSLWAHNVVIRDGDRIFETRVTGSVPFQSYTEKNFFDAEGHVIETVTHDENGGLSKRHIAQIPIDQGHLTAFQSRETDAAGHETTGETEERTDPKTGITRQIATVNGQPLTDWTIQRNQDGMPVKDKIVYADGSYNEREQLPDGTTVEDRYSVPTKSHTYQKSTTKNGRLIEVIDESNGSYTRCTYSFDKAGRPTGQINYDKAGAILDKTSNEYTDDEVGNWIEERVFQWNTKTDPATKTLLMITSRSIAYY